MTTKNPIDALTIKGFKSIKELDRLYLSPLNVLIGANGVGKSNFVSYFRMLGELVGLRLQQWTTNQGSADRIVTFGIKETVKFESIIEFGRNAYRFDLEPTVDGGFSFVDERLFFKGPDLGAEWNSLGSGHKEAKLRA